MVVRCCVSGCNVSAKEGIKMHVLPKNYERRRLWCNAINRLDLLEIEESKRRNVIRICDGHFLEKDKLTFSNVKTSLKFDALPIVIPGCSSDLVKVAERELSAPVEEMTILEISSTYLSTYKRSASPLPRPSKVPHMMLTTPKSKCGILQARLLNTVGVASRKQLTLRPRKLFSCARNLQKIAKRLDFQNADNKERLANAINYSESEEFLRTKVNEQSLRFILCQLRMQGKSPRGRRFSFEDKIFALSLLKQRPLSYKILRRTFALPRRKTLTTLLNKIPFNVGINNTVLNVLKDSLLKMNILDRTCILLFDEMSLEPLLSYDKKNDTILGLEDTGEERKLKFADHALVLLLKGIRKKWKQPVSYYFNQGRFNATELRNILRSTIEALQAIGFNIVATVCDQFSANVNAIKQLVESSNQERGGGNKFPLFLIGDQEIVGIFDPPHLLKGIRNNLLKHDVKFKIDGTEKIASWKNIQTLYELDIGDFNTRMCYKLTDSHIYEEKMKKMKVKYAAQVFSHRVSSTLRWTAKFGKETVLYQSAEGTADFVSLIDQLFDSVNGSTYEADHGKELRCAVTTQSPHLEFWKKSITILSSAKFQTEKGEVVPPSLLNWIKTLHSFIYLWKRLSKIGFKYLCPRNINQDPLENFFGCIRSHGVRNVNPSCSSFVSSFKTLLINNFTSTHSPGANCENDHNYALNSLQLFLQQNIEEDTNDDHEENVTYDAEKLQFNEEEDETIINAHAYTTGFIAKLIFKKVGKCSVCFNQLIASFSSSEHELITLREYRYQSLLRPRTQFRRMFSKMVKLFTTFFKEFILKRNVKKNLTQVFRRQLSNPFVCNQHDIFNIFISQFLSFFIHTYIKNVNKILKGQTTVLKGDNDEIKLLAQSRYNKLKGKNKKVTYIKKLVH